MDSAGRGYGYRSIPPPARDSGLRVPHAEL